LLSIVTSSTGNAHSSAAPEFIPRFNWSLCWSICSSWRFNFPRKLKRICKNKYLVSTCQSIISEIYFTSSLWQSLEKESGIYTTNVMTSNPADGEVYSIQY
jgi:hypothetical protein